VAAADRVFAVLELQPSIGDAGAAISKRDIIGNVEFKSVKFHYQMRPDNAVLKDINLSIRGGSVCAIVGKSGGGKTTILNLLQRFYDPTEGAIYLDGIDITKYNVKQYRSLFGIVSQDTELMNASIEENIAYGIIRFSFAVSLFLCVFIFFSFPHFRRSRFLFVSFFFPSSFFSLCLLLIFRC
jgi:ABC-type multidrug transport system fused ATPase/permease subunit